MIRFFSGPKFVLAQRRASLNAASLASPPELQKNTRSANVSSVSRCASLSAGSLVTTFDRCQSFCACWFSALTITGLAWPSTVTQIPPAQSTYSRTYYAPPRDQPGRETYREKGCHEGKH